MPESLVYRRLRAPGENNQLLCEPPRAQIPATVQGNRQQMSQACESATAGETDSVFNLAEVRRMVRGDLLRLAVRFTRRYAPWEIGDSPVIDPGLAALESIVSEQDDREFAQRSDSGSPGSDIGGADPQVPLLVSGHQPELYHAGVWAKSFALDCFSRDVHGVGIQVNIDNDLCRTPAIKVPTGSLADPRATYVPFDRAAEATPFEERKILDREIFDSFPNRVTAALRGVIARPLVQELWPRARQAADRGAGLGASIAEARHRLELEWGLRTIEVPLSWLCETPGFACFAQHLLARAGEVQIVYNESLEAYRRVHRLRSPAQPLPDLQRRDGFYETPFWIWTKFAPSRRPLWVQLGSKQWILSDGRSQVAQIPAGPSSGQGAGMAAAGTGVGFGAWSEMWRAGIRVRPRALATTIFLRVFAADLFIHGIGGAKYDQVTDLLIARLWHIPPPRFATVSATLRLPVSLPQVTRRQLTELTGELRQMNFHPENFLPPDVVSQSQVSRSIAEKKSWWKSEIPRRRRKTQHRRIEAINAFLRGFLEEDCSRIEQSRSILVKQLETVRHLGSREWPFCLFPPDDLRTRLLELLGSAP